MSFDKPAFNFCCVELEFKGNRAEVSAVVGFALQTDGRYTAAAVSKPGWCWVRLKLSVPGASS